MRHAAFASIDWQASAIKPPTWAQGALHFELCHTLPHQGQCIAPKAKKGIEGPTCGFLVFTESQVKQFFAIKMERALNLDSERLSRVL